MQDFFKHFFKHDLIGSAVIQSDRCIFVNEKFTSITGLSVAQLNLLIEHKEIEYLQSAQDESGYTVCLFKNTLAGTPITFKAIVTSIEYHEMLFRRFDVLSDDLFQVFNQNNGEYNELLEFNRKLFSILNHDLKNPLSVLITLSKLLNDEIVSFTSDEITETALTIYNSANHSIDILNETLTWAKAKAGLLRYEPKPIEISELVQQVMADLHARAQKKCLKLFQKVITTTIIADPDMVSAILKNLVYNAIKFTKRGGSVSLNVTADENNVEFAITDTGIGIEQKHLDMLLNNEMTSSRAGTDDEKGTGLGLLICKEFVRINGGKLRATSEIGKGSSFHFTIPRAGLVQGVLESGDDEHVTEFQSRNMHTLLIESGVTEYSDELILAIDNELIPLYTKILKTSSIAAIKDFAQHLIIIGTDYSNEFLCSYGSELQQNARLFKIDKIMQLLPKFAKFVEQCKRNTFTD